MDTDRRATVVPLSQHDGSTLAFAAGSAPLLNIVRHLIWPVGPFQADVRIESTDRSSRYKIAGQVVHSCDNSVPQPDITVSLFNEAAELARVITDQFGEFSIEHSHAGKLQLRLAFSDEIYASVDMGEGVYTDGS